MYMQSTFKKNGKRWGKKFKVINFLKKNNASYRIWKVIPGQDELEKLR